MGKCQWECDGGYVSVGGVSAVARTRCVELVSIWIVGGVGAVYEGRDSKGSVKWVEGVVGWHGGGRESCAVHQRGGLVGVGRMSG